MPPFAPACSVTMDLMLVLDESGSMNLRSVIEEVKWFGERWTNSFVRG